MNHQINFDTNLMSSNYTENNNSFYGQVFCLSNIFSMIVSNIGLADELSDIYIYHVDVYTVCI